MPIRRTASTAVLAVTLTAGLTLSGAAVAQAESGSASAPGSLSSLSSLDVLGSLGLDEAASDGILASVPNFRDVAGDGYATADGGTMKKGVFYRSDAPTDTSAEDLATLSDLGVTAAYDMRADSEISTPVIGGEDVLPDSTEYVHTAIKFGDFMELARQIDSPAEAEQYMEDTYGAFVTDPARRAGFATVLQDLADHDGAQVFHCTSGKDRTGWVSYLLQSVAGVNDSTKMTDYLESNDRLEASNAKTLKILGLLGTATGSLGSADLAGSAGSLTAVGPDAAENLQPLLVVKKEYLQAGIDAIDSEYGDVDTYLTDGLGLSAATITTLHDKLVG